jgi:hypothetical protein
LTDIFREVDEEVRKDRLSALWKKYGAWILSGCLLLVAATAGFTYWRNYQRLQLAAQADRFLAAMELAQQGKAAEAAATFAEIGREGSAGYSALARLQEAAARTRLGSREAALASYDQLAADGGAPALLRNAARLGAAMLVLETAPAADLERRLAPLLAAGNPWHHSARELQALLANREGQTSAARAAFSALAQDATAPAGVQARARQLLLAIGPGG